MVNGFMHMGIGKFGCGVSHQIVGKNYWKEHLSCGQAGKAKCDINLVHNLKRGVQYG